MQKIHPRLMDGNNRNLWFAAKAIGLPLLATRAVNFVAGFEKCRIG